MLGAAVVVSCNNDSIGGDPNGGGDPTNPEIVEGVTTYATFDLVPKSASTYAGQGELQGEDGEMNLTGAHAALMIYDNANVPKAFAYVSLGSGKSVTLKTTSGTKKLFLAANIGTAPKTFVKMNTAGVTTPDEGSEFAVAFADMNRTLFSEAATWDTIAPTATVRKADGLIRGLAGGAETYAQGIIHTTVAPSATAANFVMANWDGPTDAAPGTPYASTCSFPLIADVPKNETQQTSGTPRNRFVINVQRAVAKVALKITSGPGGTYPAQYYTGGSGEAKEGRFYPILNSANSPIWVTGNIHKEAKVFQNYTGGVVQDHNALQVDDSIMHFNTWIKRYDNTRFFGNATAYPAKGVITVATVEANMKLADNFQVLNDGSLPAWDNRKYSYVPENARKAPVYGDYATYVVTLGEYVPKTFVDTIYYPAVAGGTPTIKTRDGYTTKPVYPATPTTVNYTNPNNGASESIRYTDTLYYLNKTGEVYFFLGMDNLVRYYAWVKKFDINATHSDVTAQTGNVNASMTEILNDMQAGFITGYQAGKCFYRVYVSNTKGASSEYNIVRRNHVYQVNITKILGPGIADPNDVIIPLPLSEADTYVTAEINVLNWHVVDQEEEVGN